MKKVIIVRDPSSPAGTFGLLTAERGFQLYTLERPGDGDHPAIPEGDYRVIWTSGLHPHHPQCYEVMNVPGRTAILIHPANWFDELLGCIALGRSIMDIQRKDGTMMRGISSSVDAVNAFVNHMGKENFQLTIKRAGA